MNEKETSKSLSTQKVLLPGHDPGWNDPPEWAYTNTQTSVATPTKRVLNKRVAFPLASAQVADKEATPQVTSKSMNMPPPLQSPMNLTTMTPPLLISPSDRKTDVNRIETEIDKNKALNRVLLNLEAVIDEHISNKTKVDEVKKRLDTMKAAWLEDKLNSTIHQKILELSIALQERNIDRADQIHISLTMHYNSLCSNWIPGIRHIILELKTKLQDSHVTQTQQLQSHLLPVQEKGANADC